jgi:hypothetical protein
MLVPAKCNCAGQIRSVASSAEHARLHLTVVGTSMPTRPSNISDSLISLRSEPTGVLLPDYDVKTRPVTLLVRSDGVVSRALHSLPTSAKLDNDVRQLANSAPSR